MRKVALCLLVLIFVVDALLAYFVGGGGTMFNFGVAGPSHARTAPAADAKSGL